jgi:hypothetical protein
MEAPMGDETTAAEVARALADHKAEQRDDYREMRETIAGALPRDVYHADCRANDERIKNVDAQFRALKETTEARFRAIEDSKVSDQAGKKAERSIRIAIAAVIVPAGLEAVGLWLTIRGHR